jgi:small conductance mechanosensitive channel
MTRFFQSVLQRLAILFDPESLGTLAADILASAIVGLVTFGVYYVAWRLLDVLARAVSRRMAVDLTTRDFVLTSVKFVVLTLGAVNALAAVGVNTASLIASLGVAGLTIGFAARDALSNMISGLLIYWDRPFVIGDLLEVGEHYGKVDRITLRSTRVITPDGRMLAVPNTEIINRTVASYTNFPHLRIDVPITIGVREQIGSVRETLLALVRDDPEYMRTPEPTVRVTALHDYNVELLLSAWAHDERRHIELRTSLREAAYEALTHAGVDMPPETFRLEPMTVHQVPA